MSVDSTTDCSVEPNKAPHNTKLRVYNGTVKRNDGVPYLLRENSLGMRQSRDRATGSSEERSPTPAQPAW